MLDTVIPDRHPSLSRVAAAVGGLLFALSLYAAIDLHGSIMLSKGFAIRIVEVTYPPGMLQTIIVLLYVSLIYALLTFGVWNRFMATSALLLAGVALWYSASMFFVSEIQPRVVVTSFYIVTATASVSSLLLLSAGIVGRRYLIEHED